MIVCWINLVTMLSQVFVNTVTYHPRVFVVTSFLLPNKWAKSSIKPDYQSVTQNFANVLCADECLAAIKLNSFSSHTSKTWYPPKPKNVSQPVSMYISLLCFSPFVYDWETLLPFQGPYVKFIHFPSIYGLSPRRLVGNGRVPSNLSLVNRL